MEESNQIITEEEVAENGDVKPGKNNFSKKMGNVIRRSKRLMSGKRRSFRGDSIEKDAPLTQLNSTVDEEMNVSLDKTDSIPSNGNGSVNHKPQRKISQTYYSGEKQVVVDGKKLKEIEITGGEKSPEPIDMKKQRKSIRKKSIDTNELNISCRDLGKADHEGWLVKKGGGHGLVPVSWKRYWCAIKNSNIYCYKTSFDIVADYVFQLKEFTIENTTEKKKVAFKLAPKEDTRKAAVFAGEKVDIIKWMDVIKNVQSGVNVSQENDSLVPDYEERKRVYSSATKTKEESKRRPSSSAFQMNTETTGMPAGFGTRTSSVSQPRVRKPSTGAGKPESCLAVGSMFSPLDDPEDAGTPAKENIDSLSSLLYKEVAVTPNDTPEVARRKQEELQKLNAEIAKLSSDMIVLDKNGERKENIVIPIQNDTKEIEEKLPSVPTTPNKDVINEDSVELAVQEDSRDKKTTSQLFRDLDATVPTEIEIDISENNQIKQESEELDITVPAAVTIDVTEHKEPELETKELDVTAPAAVTIDVTEHKEPELETKELDVTAPAAVTIDVTEHKEPELETKELDVTVPSTVTIDVTEHKEPELETKELDVTVPSAVTIDVTEHKEPELETKELDVTVPTEVTIDVTEHKEPELETKELDVTVPSAVTIDVIEHKEPELETKEFDATVPTEVTINVTEHKEPELETKELDGTVPAEVASNVNVEESIQEAVKAAATDDIASVTIEVAEVSRDEVEEDEQTSEFKADVIKCQPRIQLTDIKVEETTVDFESKIITESKSEVSENEANTDTILSKPEIEEPASSEVRHIEEAASDIVLAGETSSTATESASPVTKEVSITTEKVVLEIPSAQSSNVVSEEDVEKSESMEISVTRTVEIIVESTDHQQEDVNDIAVETEVTSESPLTEVKTDVVTEEIKTEVEVSSNEEVEVSSSEDAAIEVSATLPGGIDDLPQHVEQTTVISVETTTLVTDTSATKKDTEQNSDANVEVISEDIQDENVTVEIKVANDEVQLCNNDETSVEEKTDKTEEHPEIHEKFVNAENHQSTKTLDDEIVTNGDDTHDEEANTKIETIKLNESVKAEIDFSTDHQKKNSVDLGEDLDIPSLNNTDTSFSDEINFELSFASDTNLKLSNENLAQENVCLNQPNGNVNHVVTAS